MHANSMLFSRRRSAPMMIVKNYVAASEIHGVELFAGEDIEKDQIVFVLTPGIDLVIHPDQTKKFGVEFARFTETYAYEDIKTGEIIISLDNARFMNHHPTPNTLMDLCLWLGCTCHPER